LFTHFPRAAVSRKTILSKVQDLQKKMALKLKDREKKPKKATRVNIHLPGM
jgi:hypothetical protein